MPYCLQVDQPERPPPRKAVIQVTTPVRSTTPKAGDTPVLSATAKGRRTAKQETTKALTASQESALRKLVDATREAITQSESNGRKAAELATELTATVDLTNDFKVYAARALVRLSGHPAVVATGGPTKGTPALTKMATLIGRPSQSLETYWKAAKALQAAKMAGRTGAPKPDERAIVAAPFKAESDRVMVSQAKGKAKVKAPRSTAAKTVSFATIEGQVDGLIKTIGELTAKVNLTPAQAKVLSAKLGEVSALVAAGTK